MIRKVIVLEDLPSNILSEAILILKNEEDKKNNDIKIKSAIAEAEYIIEECMYKLEKQSAPKKNFFHKILDKVKGSGNKK